MADKMNTDYWNNFYSGIIPSPGSSPPVSSYLTPAEQAQMQQQQAQSQALQAGYNPDGTPKQKPSWVNPPITLPVTEPPATWGPFEQAQWDAANKPGTWMAQSRMQSEALMRQQAVQRNNRSKGGLASLVTGQGTPRGAGGLAALVAPASFQTSNTGRSVNVGQNYQGTNGYTYQATPNGTFSNQGYSAEELAKRAAQGQAIGDANRASATPTYTVTGDNNSFMPTSVQNSTRWQTGY